MNDEMVTFEQVIKRRIVAEMKENRVATIAEVSESDWTALRDKLVAQGRARAIGDTPSTVTHIRLATAAGFVEIIPKAYVQSGEVFLVSRLA